MRRAEQIREQLRVRGLRLERRAEDEVSSRSSPERPERPERRPDPERRPEQERRPSRGVGTVRFAVTPWAEVTCGGHRLGNTPFPDQRLPAGSYECRFTHPELGTRTQRVEVRANEESRVTLKF